MWNSLLLRKIIENPLIGSNIDTGLCSKTIASTSSGSIFVTSLEVARYGLTFSAQERCRFLFFGDDSPSRCPWPFCDSREGVILTGHHRDRFVLIIWEMVYMVWFLLGDPRESKRNSRTSLHSARPVYQLTDHRSYLLGSSQSISLHTLFHFARTMQSPFGMFSAGSPLKTAICCLSHWRLAWKIALRQIEPMWRK